MIFKQFNTKLIIIIALASIFINTGFFIALIYVVFNAQTGF